MTDFRELPPQARSARVTYLLMLRGALSTTEIMEATGITTNAGVNYIMDNVSLVVPLYKKKGTGLYTLLRPWENLDANRSMNNGE
jgi:hypothetical protein